MLNDVAFIIHARSEDKMAESNIVSEGLAQGPYTVTV